MSRVTMSASHELDDLYLLAAAATGDEQAFGKLASHHLPGLELYCRLMLGCPQAAREAVDEALLCGWRGLRHAAPRVSARIWLYRLATTVCLEGLERGRSTGDG